MATREALLQGGESGPAIVPGDPGASLLIQLVEHEREPAMPWRRKQLSADARAQLRRWIELGAPYDRDRLDDDEETSLPGPLVGAAEVSDDDRDHWSFRRLHPTAPPPVVDEGWCRTPIDRFILAQQETEGLRPNAAADRRTLLRRASFGLLGLPPTFEDVAAFVGDARADAWSRQVERLLSSPRFGERWARHWLDAARFAESHGFEQDYDRPNAHHYRDYVIRAFNRDQPYDEFIRWQIAGDEIAPEDPEAWRATGFLAAGAFPTQLTEREFERARYDELDDMVGTLGTAMLGMTIGCARCHDHKFDPIPTRDYYRLVATFTGTIRSNVELEADAARVQARHEAWQAELEPFAARLAELERTVLAGRFESWLAERAVDPQPRWRILDVTSATSSGGAHLEREPDGSWVATGANPDHDTWELVARSSPGRITGLRLEALADDALVRAGPGRATNGNFALSDLRLAVRSATGQRTPVPMTVVEASFEQAKLPVSATIDDDPISAWAIDPRFGEDHAAVYRFRRPLELPEDAVLEVRLSFANNVGHGMGRLRVAVTSEPDPRWGVDSRLGAWQLAGPFEAPDRASALETAWVTEPGGTEPHGSSDAWTDRSDLVDGKGYPLKGEIAATYLRRRIDAPSPRRLAFRVGSDDAIRIWLNGELVHEQTQPRGLTVGQDPVEVTLRAGTNRLLMKVVNFGGGYGFSFGDITESTLEGWSVALGSQLTNGEPLTPRQRAALWKEWIQRDPDWRRLAAPVEALRAREPRSSKVTVLAASEGVKPIPHHADGRGFPHFYPQTHLLERGDPDRKGEVVEPGFLQVLTDPEASDRWPPTPPPSGRSPGQRSALAAWMTDIDQGAGALLARVVVNRIWHHHFGRGLVSTPNDFGAQGAPPTHPDLLEWLAVELVQSGWRLKHIHRLILESAVYRQSGAVDETRRAIDPDNRSWWHRAPRRLEAEAIRDTLLQVTGRLDTTMFGPGSLDEGNARRSVYLFQKRGRLLPMMQVFDAPQHLVSIGRRSTTTTAPQALLLLNNENVRGLARAFGEQLAESGEPVVEAFRRTLARDPKPAEQQAVQAFLEGQSARPGAWVDLAQTMFALNEFIYVD